MDSIRCAHNAAIKTTLHTEQKPPTTQLLCDPICNTVRNHYTEATVVHVPRAAAAADVCDRTADPPRTLGDVRRINPKPSALTPN